MEKALAIITARGGSKRIPYKNIREFNGYPIIKYSIEAAIRSNCFDEVMVSTDDKKIAEIAASFGAIIPFYRRTDLANDVASTADVIQDVINEYKKQGREFKFVCCIYPTAPFITEEKLSLGLKLLQKTNADTVLPIVKYSYPIQRAFKLVNQKIEMFHPENINKRSQDLVSAYHDAGQFYWLKVSKFLEKKQLFTDNTYPIILSELEVHDIDNEDDWKTAEIKYNILKQREK